MAKPLRIFLWIVGTLVVLVVGAAIALPLVINPNNYKGEIAKGVKDSTGRELTIDNISLRVFPWLGVAVTNLKLGNAPGFGPEPFAEVAEAEAGIRILPLLLHKEIRIGTVKVHGLHVNLAQNPQANNWADLAKADEQPPAPEPKVEGRTEFDASKLEIGGLDLKDIRLSFKSTDAQGKVTEQKIENLNLETGPIRLNQPVDLTVSMVASATEPAITADMKLTAKLIHDLDKKVFGTDDLKFEVTAKGDTVPGGKQTATLTGNARYSQAEGTFALTDTKLDAAGLVLTAAVNGTGLAGDAPKLTGKFSTNSFNPREVAKQFGVALPPTTDPKALTQVSFNADYAGDFENARLEPMTLKLDQTTASGFVNVAHFADPAITFALKLDALDADRYMAPPTAAPDTKEAEAGGDFRKIELPAKALDAVNAKGTVELGALTAKGVKMTNVKLTLDAPKGQVKTQELVAQLYGGRMVQSARITPGATPRYDLKAGLDGVNSQPLLQAFTGKTWLSGLGNFDLGVSGTGLTVGDVMKTMDGALASSFVNGALEGFNLKQTIEQAKALSQGQPAAASDAPKRTEFSDLKGSGKFENGVLKTETLNASGADYKLTGGGNIDLVGMKIDYLLKPTYTGGSVPKDLQGMAIPVKITGNLLDPKIRVDLAGVLKSQAKQAVDKEVQKQEKKLKKKLGDKLGDYLKKQQPESQPQEQPPSQ